MSPEIQNAYQWSKNKDFDRSKKIIKKHPLPPPPKKSRGKENILWVPKKDFYPHPTSKILKKQQRHKKPIMLVPWRWACRSWRRSWPLGTWGPCYHSAWRGSSPSRSACTGRRTLNCCAQIQGTLTGKNRTHVFTGNSHVFKGRWQIETQGISSCCENGLSRVEIAR